MIDLKECNEEYWNARKAERQPMRRVGAVKSDGQSLEEIAITLGKRIIDRAKEFGVHDSEIDAMRKRMNDWLSRCKAHQRDLGELMRTKVNDKDKPALKWQIAEMRWAQDDQREDIFK